MCHIGIFLTLFNRQRRRSSGVAQVQDKVVAVARPSSLRLSDRGLRMMSLPVYSQIEGGKREIDDEDVEQHRPPDVSAMSDRGGRSRRLVIDARSHSHH